MICWALYSEQHFRKSVSVKEKILIFKQREYIVEMFSKLVFPLPLYPEEVLEDL
jgi:hypothetical protein